MRESPFLALLTLSTACYSGLDIDPLPYDPPPAAGDDGSDDPDRSSGGDDDDDDGEPADVDPECDDIRAKVAPLRRLTRTQYNNTLRDILGDDSNPADRFVVDERVGMFATNSNAPVTALAVEEYMDAAEEIAARAVEDLGQLTSCDPAVEGELSCADAFITEYGRRFFRRPLTDSEFAALQGVYAAGDDEPYAERVELVLQALLQAPQFLYRLEFDPDAGPGDLVALDDFELATRLSYFMWATTPDDALLDAAERGELSTDEGLRAQTTRMVEDPRFDSTLGGFVEQWLDLGELDATSKDPTLYPEFAGLADAMLAETEDFTRELMRSEDPTLPALLTASHTYALPELAAFYGAEHGGGPGEVRRIELDPTQRRGILTQASVMASHAKENDTSPILRGAVVRNRVLCQDLPPPPPDVDSTPPDPDPNASDRDRFEEHTSNPACAGCHVLMDPLGFGFEHYDAMGAFRWEDAGQPVDASGEVVATEDIDGAFDGAIELADRLAGSKQVSQCFAGLWLEYGTGQSQPANECAPQTVHAQFVEDGLSIPALIERVVMSDAFRTMEVQ